MLSNAKCNAEQHWLMLSTMEEQKAQKRENDGSRGNKIWEKANPRAAEGWGPAAQNKIQEL